MAASFAAVTGTVTIKVGSSDVPIVVATFEVPAKLTVDRVSPGVVEIGASVSSDTVLRDVVAELRRLADHWDPDVDTETVDLPVDLAPGAVVIHCPDCNDTIAGMPGEQLVHTGPGEHVFTMTYGGGA